MKKEAKYYYYCGNQLCTPCISKKRDKKYKAPEKRLQGKKLKREYSSSKNSQAMQGEQDENVGDESSNLPQKLKSSPTDFANVKPMT